MAATYDNTLPTARDRARYKLGDINVAAPLLEDETYDALIDAQGEAQAIATLAEGLAARFAQKPDSISSQGDSISWRSRISTWLELAKTARDDSGTARSVQATRFDDTDSEYVRPENTVWFTG